MIGYWIVIGIMIIAITAVLLAVNVSPESEDAMDTMSGLSHADSESLASDRAQPEP